jgi:predicted nucleic acid-binding protein
VKVFLDANILFSAADPESATRRLLEAVAGLGAVVTSPHAWEEARRNLQQKRPAHLKGLKDLPRYVEITSAFAEAPAVGLPACDIPILSGAIGAECAHLWTSDKQHFGKFYGKSISGVRIVSSIALADELLKSRQQ